MPDESFFLKKNNNTRVNPLVCDLMTRQQGHANAAAGSSTISVLVDREIMGYVKESHAHQRNRTKVSFWRPIAGNGAHATNGTQDLKIFPLKTIRTDDPAPATISRHGCYRKLIPLEYD